MKILIVGGGGREHALAWKIAQSPLVDTLFAAPGNPGIARHASCVAIGVEAYDDLVAFARRERVDLVVVGPEVPLVAGLADHLAAAGLAVFGPSPGRCMNSTTSAGMRSLRFARASISPCSTIWTIFSSIVLPIPGSSLAAPSSAS